MLLAYESRALSPRPSLWLLVFAYLTSACSDTPGPSPDASDASATPDASVSASDASTDVSDASRDAADATAAPPIDATMLSTSEGGVDAGVADATASSNVPSASARDFDASPDATLSDATLLDAARDASPAAEAGDAGEMRLPGDAVFADDQVLEIRLTLTPEDKTFLDEHGNFESYVRARAQISGAGFGSIDLPDVGLRHKGAWSLHHCWDDHGGVRSTANECAKLSYKLSFDEYAADTRFEGLARLNLNASSGDPTKLRELLAYSTFRDFGVTAPRTALARVIVNDEVSGVFIAVEDIDESFLSAHFPDGAGGNLFKEVWPAEAQERDTFVDSLETNTDAPLIGDMLGFAYAVSTSTPETFESKMAEWTSLDKLVRYVAVDRALKNWDGITAFYSPLTPHNFYWYHDTGAEARFHLIPWDLDNTFGAYDPYMAPEESGWIQVPAIPDWNVKPAHCNPRPVWDISGTTQVTAPRCDALLNLLAVTQTDKFVDVGDELLATALSEPVTSAKLDQWTALLGPLVLEDPTLDPSLVELEQALFRDTLDDIRADFGAALLEGLQEEFAPTVPVLRPEPTEEELLAPGYAGGLALDRVNNFDWVDGVPGYEPPASFSIGDGLSTFSTLWNTATPIAGSGDIRIDFNHVREASATYNEWVNLNLWVDGPTAVDLRDYTQIVMSLRSDQPRQVRVRLASSAYGNEFGGVWGEFGDYAQVSEVAGQFVLPLRGLAYPNWAKAQWQPGQGWSVTDPEALEIVLSQFTGLTFVPGPILDAYGELAAANDPGFLEVDSIYFQ